MKKIWWAIGLGLVLAGCATSAVKTSWLDPQHRLKNYQKVMIMAIAQNDLNQRAFEDHCVNLWREYGVTGVPSYSAFPGQAKHDKAAMAQYLAGQGIGAILVVRMIGSDTLTVQNPAVTTVTYGDPHYGGGGYYGYYESSHTIVNQPATTSEYNVTTIESRLFNTKTQQTIGIVETESITEKQSGVVTKQIQELARIVTQALMQP